MEVSH